MVPLQKVVRIRGGSGASSASVESLLGFLGNVCGALGPCELVCDVHA